MDKISKAVSNQQTKFRNKLSNLQVDDPKVLMLYQITLGMIIQQTN